MSKFKYVFFIFHVNIFVDSLRFWSHVCISGLGIDEYGTASSAVSLSCTLNSYLSCGAEQKASEGSMVWKIGM